MEVELRSSSGAGIRLVGTDDEIRYLIDLVKDEGPGLLTVVGENATDVRPSPSGEDDAPRTGGDPRELSVRLERIDASSDIERMTVMAQHAVENGLEGLTTEVAQRWYTELGLPKPGVWSSTFGNAKQRGYLHHTAAGWRPTTAGENLALHGIRRPAGRRRSRRAAED